MFDEVFILIIICFTVTALTNEPCKRKYSEKYCKRSKLIYLSIYIYLFLFSLKPIMKQKFLNIKHEYCLFKTTIYLDTNKNICSQPVVLLNFSNHFLCDF